MYLRTFAWLLSVCALLGFSALAHAQQLDLAVSGSTLVSSKNTTSSLNYLAPPEKAGIYPGVSLERTFKNHFGYLAEVNYRYHQAIYNNYQRYRPILYDANAVYAPRLAKRMNADLMAGIGGQHVIFDSPFGGCGYSAGCTARFNSNQFLFHIGGGVHYQLWRGFFIRPEAHYYFIVHNTDNFHSDNVLRLGASVGYTFHRD